MNNIDSLKEQLVKITLYFYHKTPKLKTELQDKTDVDEFVNIVFQFFLDRNLFNKYDENKSTFSTFVVYILNLHYLIFINMIKYNISFQQARKLVNLANGLNKKDSSIYHDEYLQAINYNQPLSLNQPVTDMITGDEIDATMLDMIVDNSKEADIEKYIENRDAYNKIIECLNKTRVFTTREKDIIRAYIKCNCSEVKAAKLLNLTRSRVSAVIVKFKRFMQKKKKTIL